MANNHRGAGKRHYEVPSHPTSGGSAGDPGYFGDVPVVLLIDQDATTNKATMATEPGKWKVSVKGIDGGGNSAVAVGDIIYYVDGDTPNLSKKNTGVKWGVALEAVGSGATADVDVLKYGV